MSYNKSAQISLKKDYEYTQLSFEQKIVFELTVFQHKNIFITGQAGSGKSHLLRMIIAAMKKVYQSNGIDKVVVTSMTGVAALNINGSTLHSAIGLNAANITDSDLSSLNVLQSKLFKKPTSQQTKERIQNMDVLIIDEVSMLSSYVLDAMDVYFQRIRGNNKLFGGVQMILCGDFMQLPPVEKQITKKVFLFQSKAFQKLDFKIQLIQQFRQLYDNNFNNILLKIRNNNIDYQVRNALESRRKNEQQLNKEQDDERKRVENEYKLEKQKLAQKYNFCVQKMNELGTQIKNFKQQNDSSRVDQHIYNIREICKYFRQVHELGICIKNIKKIEPQFPIRLYSNNDKVKEYNQTMLMKNNRGIIFLIESEDNNKMKSDDNDKLFQVDRQIRIAEGAQVMVCKNIDLKANIVNGSVGYVEKIDFKNDYKTYQKGDMEYRELHAVINEVCVFVNIYEGGFGNNQKQQIRRVAIKPFKFELKTVNDKFQASRVQIPLTLAYALTIHKSQGITLNRAVIDLNNPFAEGIAYVALSRLKTLNGLTLTGINYQKIQVNKECVDFYNNIDKIDLSDISISKMLGRVWQNQAKNYLCNQNQVLSDEFEQILKERNIRFNTPLISKSQRIASGSQGNIGVIIPQINDSQHNSILQSQQHSSKQNNVNSGDKNNQQKSNDSNNNNTVSQQNNIIVNNSRNLIINTNVTNNSSNNNTVKQKTLSVSLIQAQQQQLANKLQSQVRQALSQTSPTTSNTKQNTVSSQKQRTPPINQQQQQRDNSIISISTSTEYVTSEDDEIVIRQVQQQDINNPNTDSPASCRSLNEKKYYMQLLNNIARKQ